MKFLLVIGCSEWKRNYEEPMPALYIYEGQVQRYLRRVLEDRKGPIDVYIVSAEYGLIGGWDYIEWYEAEITSRRVESIKEETTKRLRSLLSSGTYTECLVALSKRYLAMIGEALVDSPISMVVTGLREDRYDTVVSWVKKVQSL